ncbi:MAG: winged helix-turn-helix domain-containing protein [Armatimonadetes bacterium]|nr:winged helix-turn-helix domain-containing protein [Armatimonadota bacterium]
MTKRFWVSLSQSRIRRYLKAAGFRWRRPRLAPACEQADKADPEAEAKQAALREALQEAGQGHRRVLFLDECALHRLPVIRSMWMRGDRIRVPTPGQNARRAFFGPDYS